MDEEKSFLQNVGKAIRNVEKAIKKIINGIKKFIKLIKHIIKYWKVYLIIGIVFVCFIILSIFIAWIEDEDGGGAGGTSGSNSTGISSSAGTSYWWPIGSLDTTEVDGKNFASGTPALGKESITRMGKDGKAYGLEIDKHEDNYAIDIGADGETNKYYAISIGEGKVTKVVSGIPEGVDESKPRGNHVVVDYGDIDVYYVHLYDGSIEVEEGDTVDYGQVIGKLGHNGSSTGPHLHFEVQKKGLCQDATEYVDPDNPRTVKVNYSEVNSSLVDYLLNFGGNATITQIDGRKYYLSYDDTAGLLTVGLDVYIDGHKDGFSVPRMGFGYCRRTSKRSG